MQGEAVMTIWGCIRTDQRKYMARTLKKTLCFVVDCVGEHEREEGRVRSVRREPQSKVLQLRKTRNQNAASMAGNGVCVPPFASRHTFGIGNVEEQDQLDRRKCFFPAILMQGPDTG